MRTIAWAIVIALVIRTFAFEPFNIPSESMLPNLQVGDYLFVSKFSYGYSRYSFPGSPPLFGGRILEGEPERGDIAVFRLPSNPDVDYIKRIVGLPGDRIQVIGGVLHINGEPVKRERIEDYTRARGDGFTQAYPQYVETLPNGVSFRTLDMFQNGPWDNTQVYTVPPGHFFGMGDNRDNSEDSRSKVGYIPAENLVGRAEIIWFSTDGSAGWFEPWKWFSALRLERFFNLLH
ncbi:signal peptidase I [Zavarzinia sp. CC-PAN008]|uniref:signal peptidase I n=1 Tax=Zavarzinia sp. CC-PAN008 TaxID=3243332 RepID=UPI003F746EF0